LLAPVYYKPKRIARKSEKTAREGLLIRKLSQTGLPQTQLVKALRMTQRRVSYIECDRYEPSMEDLITICRYFRISADYLLGIPYNYDCPTF